MDIRCTILRGGTSKGIYMLENDLPQDPELREKVILRIFGSPDKRQIDGLGGADPLTSKTAIVGPSARPGIDVEYTFGQVAIDHPKVYYHSLCGNITSGVGPFAVNMGLVPITEPVTVVHMFNRNTGKVLIAEVPVKNGRYLETGDYAIAGVPGRGGRINVDFRNTAGALTGKLLPTGNTRDRVQAGPFGAIEVSIVDTATCQIYVRASDLGLRGTESPAQVDDNPELLKTLESIRCQGAVLAGLASSPEEAAEKRKNTPHLSIVSPPQDYLSYLNNMPVAKEDIDFTARMMFMQIMHKTYAGTGSICTAVASRIPGTLVNEVSSQAHPLQVRFGHPGGIISVDAVVEPENTAYVVKQACIGRTARQIMTGLVSVPDVI